LLILKFANLLIIPARVARTCLCGSHCLSCYDLASVSF